MTTDSNTHLHLALTGIKSNEISTKRELAKSIIIYNSLNSLVLIPEMIPETDPELVI